MPSHTENNTKERWIMTEDNATKPWGLSRVSDFAETIEVGHASVELDPETQTSRYLGLDGRMMAPPKHGSGTETHPPTATNQDGRSDSDFGFDGDRD
jgi:putative ATP-grasp target RiPP